MIEFTRKEVIEIFIATIFLSFGITIPFGILLFVHILIKKINIFQKEKIQEPFSTLFVN